jgi:hypothetical protein
LARIDPALAGTVAEIIEDHTVSLVISFDWGAELEPYCTACGYFGNEDPALHTANIVLEYVEGYYKERFGDERH